MNRLIVCCDGTWNTPENESVTNVCRLYNALASKDNFGNCQWRYYQPGVGAVRTRLLGGAFGLGLSRNVMDAYLWLTTRYEPGDRIALFGFSRGAYTARSLAGMISACGLIDTSKMDKATVWSHIKDLYNQGYRRTRQNPVCREPHGSRERAECRGWRDGLGFLWDSDDCERIPVDFIGVWDTVGALGVPNYMGWLNLLDPARLHDFHDLRLNPYIKYGRHAIAMDERRRPYTPTLWSGTYAEDQVKQVWFPGSHKDVGGGHLQRGLSDCALQWMIDEAGTTIGLGFHKTVEDQITPNPLDVIHDDDRGVVGVLEPLIDPMLKPWLEIFQQPRPRAVPRIAPDARDPRRLHQSVYDRYESPLVTSGLYRPTEVLAPGQTKTGIEVYAHNPWNETGLYLEPGYYSFTAEGTWRDLTIVSGPDGTTGVRRFNPLTEGYRLLGTLLGQGEKLFRFVTRNKVADLIGAPREADLPWMSLVGVVANDAVSLDNEYKDHERIAIGTGTSCWVTQGGYLYAFANDAWGFYANNQGSVQLTVTRMAEREQQETVPTPSGRESGQRRTVSADEVAGAASRRPSAPSAARRAASASASRVRRREARQE
ncbi:DUF2235 domain-containing protein [Nonomuraea sp. NBC_00507]|uniref:DUF2235 domain-containing protein n=1 Tax=Nonomuraea sp. NBC_00507 TaxID=2976002 RepID=UPI002E1772B9